MHASSQWKALRQATQSMQAVFGHKGRTRYIFTQCTQAQEPIIKNHKRHEITVTNTLVDFIEMRPIHTTEGKT